MALKAGKLREVLVIETPERTKTDSGGAITTYVPKYTVRAAVNEIRSDPTLIASQEDIVQVVSFLIRYRPSIFIVNGDRLLWREKVFTVNNLKVDALRTSIELLCTSEINTSQRSEPIYYDTFDFTFDETFN
jgi:SPP1 family predicted phage head-tail adaptor